MASPIQRLLDFGFSQLPAALRLQVMRMVRKDWYERVNLALECPDNAFIQRVPGAGDVTKNLQTMHNGLRIHRASYYGESMSVMLELNRGVHEPQEERIFQEVLKCIPPGGTILELGAYWCFYSMWFAQAIPSAKLLLVEPDPVNLAFGKSNLALNGFSGEFLQGYAGAGPPGDPIPTYNVDELVERYKIEVLNILHSDIQGAEFEMLRGAEKTFARNAIDFAFISTHSEQLHEQCLGFLRDRRFTIMGEASPADSYSFDGLIAARREGLSEPPLIDISHRTTAAVRADKAK